jgi:hypothetical protein
MFAGGFHLLRDRNCRHRFIGTAGGLSRRAFVAIIECITTRKE